MTNDPEILANASAARRLQVCTLPSYAVLAPLAPARDAPSPAGIGATPAARRTCRLRHF